MRLSIGQRGQDLASFAASAPRPPRVWQDGGDNEPTDFLAVDDHGDLLIGPQDTPVLVASRAGLV